MSRPSDTEVRQALKHPLRRRLLPMFVASKQLSPREAASFSGEPLTRVTYHVKELVKYNFLVLDRREPVRGALKNYYVPNKEVLELPAVIELLAQSQLEQT